MLTQLKLFCNIVGKRVEKRCCAFYQPRSILACNKSGFCRLQTVVANGREVVLTFVDKVSMLGLIAMRLVQRAQL